jgi:hypothetical protein
VLDFPFAADFDYLDVQCAEGFDEAIQSGDVGLASGFEGLGFLCQAVLEFGEVLLLLSGWCELLSCLLSGLSLSLNFLLFLGPNLLNLFLQLLLNLLFVQVPGQPLALLSFQHIHHFGQSPGLSQ